VTYDPNYKKNAPSVTDPVVSEAYEGIIEHLTQREFPVVNRENQGLKIPKPAEYSLVYSIKPDKEDFTGVFHTKWIMIFTKIINASTGQVLANEAKKVLGTDRDSMELASLKAARKAGKLAAGFLERKITKRWAGESNSGRPVKLEITNLKSQPTVKKLRIRIANIYAVKNVFLRNPNANLTEYEVTYVGDTAVLNEKICDILADLGLMIKEFSYTGDLIRVKLFDGTSVAN
jgi:ribonuclease BN (tRNA processing enzyme)